VFVPELLLASSATVFGGPKINATTGRILQTFAVNEFLNSLSASAYASLFLHVTHNARRF